MLLIFLICLGSIILIISIYLNCMGAYKNYLEVNRLTSSVRPDNQNNEQNNQQNNIPIAQGIRVYYMNRNLTVIDVSSKNEQIEQPRVVDIL